MTISLHNLRQVADLPLPHGRHVRPGVLFRSAAPLRQDPGVVAEVVALGVRRVVDLRDSAEREQSPDVWTGSGLKVSQVPIFQNQLRELRYDSLTSLYRHMVGRRGAALASAVTELVRPPASPVLVHCTAGKDRTGLVVALVLELLGAHRRDVLSDYARSQEMLGGAYLIDLFGVNAAGSLPGMAAHRATASPAQLLGGVLQDLDTHFGGAEPYLLAHGMPSEVPAALQAMLAEPDEPV